MDRETDNLHSLRNFRQWTLTGLIYPRCYNVVISYREYTHRGTYTHFIWCRFNEKQERMLSTLYTLQYDNIIVFIWSLYHTLLRWLIYFVIFSFYMNNKSLYPSLCVANTWENVLTASHAGDGKVFNLIKVPLDANDFNASGRGELTS